MNGTEVSVTRLASLLKVYSSLPSGRTLVKGWDDVCDSTRLDGGNGNDKGVALRDGGKLADGGAGLVKSLEDGGASLVEARMGGFVAWRPGG